MKLHLPTTPGPWPVIVVSHGGGGHLDANFAQAKDLAQHGYLALCVEHIGSNTEVLKAGRPREQLQKMVRDATEVLGRPRDVSFALDQASSWNRENANLQGKLDLKRVGVLGHSFGAYTSLALAGARPSLDRLQPAQGEGLGPSLADPRIRAAVALSPQGPGSFFQKESYASIRIPVLGISGSKDSQESQSAESRRQFFQLTPGPDVTLLWLTGADHMTFSDPTGSSRRALPSASREDGQPLVREATRLWFDLYLKGDQGARNKLSEKYLGGFCRGAIPALQIQTK